MTYKEVAARAGNPKAARAVGAIEHETFIFRDNGAVDNGNQTLGDGGETVDYFHFVTSVPVTLDGYSLWLPTDYGQQNAYRSTALVRLTIDDVVVDFFDNDGRNGTQVRSFVEGPVTGQDFRIDLTRVTTGGPRIAEIDAVLAEGFEPSTVEWFGATLHASIYVVPEPSAWVLVTALVLLAGSGTAYGPVTGVRYPFTNGRQFVDTRDVEELRKRGYLLA